MLKFWFAGFLVVVFVLFCDPDVVAATSAVVLFFVGPVVSALAGSFHFLVAGFAVAVLLAVPVHHMTASISLDWMVSNL